MDEFEQLKAWLKAWHMRRDQLAMRKFIETWLQPSVRRQAQPCRLPPDEVDDLIQTTAVFFSSYPALATKAESFGYWRTQIEWKLKDFLRQRGKLRKRFTQPDHDAPEPGERPTEHPSAFEDRFVASLGSGGVDRGAWLQARLAAMPVSRRVFFMVHYHRELGAFFVEADFDEIHRRCGWARARIDAFFATDPGGDPNTLLPLLFKTDEIAGNRARCLDTFRKGRKRAFEDLQRSISEDAA